MKTCGGCKHNPGRSGMCYEGVTAEKNAGDFGCTRYKKIPKPIEFEAVVEAGHFYVGGSQNCVTAIRVPQCDEGQRVKVTLIPLGG